MNFDLHSHSTASDGEWSPSRLAERAAANGVEVWALTDHDVLGGLAEAREAASDARIEFVDGVEISVTWRGQTIHVLGLGIDPSDPDLQLGLERVRGSRRLRALRIAGELERAGIRNALEGAYRYAEDPDLISRTHFARHLVQIGRARDLAGVFKRYLSPGRIGYVAHEWAPLDGAVRWIRGAGGQAVIAHPGRYDLSPAVLEALVLEFKAAGGTGIEVVTASHSPGQYDLFARLAARFGLAASRGSDFHGPSEGRLDLGRLAALPAGPESIVDALGIALAPPVAA